MPGIRGIILLACPLLLMAQGTDSLVAKGIAEFHRGQYAAARETLQNASSTQHGRTFLALARAATGGCEEVIPDLARQLEENTDADLRRLAGIGLVQCHLARNRFDVAFPVVTRLKALYPADPDVLYQVAKLHMKAWNDVVYQMYQKAPASYRVNQISAEIFEVQGKYTEAVSEYRKAIEKNPVALNLHYRLGRALLMESHAPETLEHARKQFDAELALNPNDAVAEYQVGQILLAEQKPGEAAVRFERAVAASPDFPEALLALGRAKLEAKQYDEAIRLLERAIQLQPNSEAAHYNLMMAYRNSGRTADALREKIELEKLQQPQQGEFTDFLKKLEEKTPKP